MNEEMYKAELERIYSEMQKLNPSDGKYATLLKRVTELASLQRTELQAALDERKVRVEEQKVRKQGELTANDILSMATNLIGIGLILNHEKINVISTKALGFVKRLRF